MNKNILNYLYKTKKITYEEYKELVEVKNFYGLDIISLVNIYHQAGLLFNKEQFKKDYELRMLFFYDNKLNLMNGDSCYVIEIQPEFNFISE